VHISVYTTTAASSYQVRLNGDIQEKWIEADDEAGYVVREVSTGGTHGVRFTKQERVSGHVTIISPFTKDAP
jgi:hypothetical protein